MPPPAQKKRKRDNDEDAASDEQVGFFASMSRFLSPNYWFGKNGTTQTGTPAVAAANNYWYEHNMNDIIECHPSSDHYDNKLSSEVANSLFLTLAREKGFNFALQTIESFPFLNEAKKLRDKLLKLNGTWKIIVPVGYKSKVMIDAELRIEMNTNSFKKSECTVFVPGLKRGRNDEHGGIVFRINQPTCTLENTECIVFTGMHTQNIGDIDLTHHELNFQPGLLIHYDPDADKIAEFVFDIRVDNLDMLELDDEEDRIDEMCRAYTFGRGDVKRVFIGENEEGGNGELDDSDDE